MLKKANLAVFVSGGGTNLQALINAENDGKLPNGKLALVLSSSSKAYALERAKKANIPCFAIERRTCTSDDEFEDNLLSYLNEFAIDAIILAGFMRILSADFIRKYENRIINVHPALIPSFCGKGFYGLHVHEAALAYGVKVTGATVHIVNATPDGGRILLQKAVDVHNDDTPETLQKRVMEEAEWVLLPEAAQRLSLSVINEKEI